MKRTLLALIIALAVVPSANDTCCDLDQPVAPVQAAASDADAPCPLHAHGGSQSPAPQPQTPVRCTHDLSIDRAGLVKTVITVAPHLTIALVVAPASADAAVVTSPAPVAPQHAPPHRGSRPDVLRI